MGVAGEPINSATDINVIAEAAGSCQSYDPLFEKHREGGRWSGEKGNSVRQYHFFFIASEKEEVNQTALAKQT